MNEKIVESLTNIKTTPRGVSVAAFPTGIQQLHPNQNPSQGRIVHTLHNKNNSVASIVPSSRVVFPTKSTAHKGLQT